MKPAGRGADVEAVAPRDVDAERVERVVELDPAPGDEARALLEPEVGLGVDQLAGAQRDRPVLADPDLAGADRAGGRGARRKEAPLGQNRVYPRLGADSPRRNGTAVRSTASMPGSPCQMFSETLELGRRIAPQGHAGAEDSLCDSPHTQIARMFVS